MSKSGLRVLSLCIVGSFLLMVPSKQTEAKVFSNVREKISNLVDKTYEKAGAAKEKVTEKINYLFSKESKDQMKLPPDPKSVDEKWVGHGTIFLYNPLTKVWSTSDIQRLRNITKGKKIALIVHGFKSGRGKIDDWVDYVSQLKFYEADGSMRNRYDLLIAYDYGDSTFGTYPIKLLGHDLDNYMGFFQDVNSIEVFAHSNGGLVSRQMLEQGKNSSGIHRLITFGTPHRGVPISSKLLNAVKILAKKDRALYDLVQSEYGNNVSSFVQELNFGDFSFTKPKLWKSREYVAVVGTEVHHMKYGLGDIMQAYFKKFQATDEDPDMVSDGLVPMISAGYTGLGFKADNFRVIFADCNHLELIGTDGATFSQDSKYAIDETVQFWGTNDYPGSTVGSRGKEINEK